MYIRVTLRSAEIYEYIEIVYKINFTISGKIDEYRCPSNLSIDCKVLLRL